jgi:hypothetical protein
MPLPSHNPLNLAGNENRVIEYDRKQPREQDSGSYKIRRISKRRGAVHKGAWGQEIRLLVEEFGSLISDVL